jgi:hypothetical protein
MLFDLNQIFSIASFSFVFSLLSRLLMTIHQSIPPFFASTAIEGQRISFSRCLPIVDQIDHLFEDLVVLLKIFGEGLVSTC